MKNDLQTNESKWSNSEGYFEDNRSERSGSVMVILCSVCIVVIVTALVLACGRLIDAINRGGSQVPPPSNQIVLDIRESGHAITDNGLSEQEIYNSISPYLVTIRCYSDTRSLIPSAQSTGMIISTNGYIIANRLLTSGAARIEIETFDGRVYAALLVGSDLVTDIAVLRSSLRTTSAVAFGSAPLYSGERIFCIGNCSGGVCAVNAGVISRVGRYLPAPAGSLFGAVRVIQTNLSFSNGLHGGFLFNRFGELSGFFPAFSYNGAGDFACAVSMSEVQQIILDIVANGHVMGRYALGVTVEEISAATASAVGLSSAGLLITNISDGSAVGEFGITEGDIIMSVDGKPCHTREALAAAVRSATGEHTLVLTVWSHIKNSVFTVSVPLVEETGQTTSAP